MGEMIAIRDAYGAALKELGEQVPNIVCLEADVASSTKSGIFGKAFPERYFNVGISELNMVSMAAWVCQGRDDSLCEYLCGFHDHQGSGPHPEPDCL